MQRFKISFTWGDQEHIEIMLYAMNHSTAFARALSCIQEGMRMDECTQIVIQPMFNEG